MQKIITNYGLRVANLKSAFRISHSAFFFLLAAHCLLFTVSCAISHGVYHTIEKGQTLWRIAKTYDVDIQDVAEFNDITDITQIKEGQKIFIPGASQVLKVESFKPAATVEPKTEERKNGFKNNELSIKHRVMVEEPVGRIVVEKWRFSWPVKGSVVSTFGVRDGRKNDGIDIAVQAGTPVAAAAEGEVIYSDDSVRSYGNIVMLKHKEGFITVYAHNQENIVKVGEAIKRGEIIAKVGSTGNAASPRLHFEVRKDRKPRNPLFFLALINML